MAGVGIHDFRNTRGVRNLAPSQQNGDPVVHEQLTAISGATLAPSTIAELRNYTDRSASTLVRPRGYYAAGDADLGVYRWDSASTAADDGGLTIRPTDVLAANPGRFINTMPILGPSDFGVLPGSDRTTNWLALAAYVNGLTVWRDGFGMEPTALELKSGIYPISSDVIFNKGVALTGQATLQLNNCKISIRPLVGGTGSTKSYTSAHVQGIQFEDASAAAVATKPLLEITGGLGCSIRNCLFDGKNRRDYTCYLGSEDPIWGTEILLNHFTNGKIGLRVGNNGDQTHLHIAGNTFDHNSVAGAMLVSCQIGRFHANSVEWNEGKIGILCLFKNPNLFQNFSIENNYVFNNGFQTPNSNDAYGILSLDLADIPAIATLPDVAGLRGGLSGCSISHNKISTADPPYGLYARSILVICNAAPNRIEYNRLTGGGIECRGGPTATIYGNSDITGGSGATIINKAFFSALGTQDTCSVSTSTGNDNNDGTTLPVASLTLALDRLKPGGTIQITNGNHALTNYTFQKSVTINIANSQACTYNNCVVPAGVTVKFTGTGLHAPGFTLSQGIIVRGSLVVADGCFLYNDFASNAYLFSPEDGGEVSIGTLAGLTLTNTGTKYLAQTSTFGFLKLARQTTPTQINLSANFNGFLSVEAYAQSGYFIFKDPGAFVRINDISYYSNDEAWKTASVQVGSGTSATTVQVAKGYLYTNSASIYGVSLPAPGNSITTKRRTTFQSAATAASIASHRPGVMPFHSGQIAGAGGYRVKIPFGLVTQQAGNRGFFGIWNNTAAPANVDPTTDITPKIGMAVINNTGTWRLICTGGAVPTVIDLGANFPVDTTTWYVLEINCASNATSVTYKVTNAATGQAATGTLSTNLPSNTTQMGVMCWLSNNATAAAVTFAIGDWKAEYN